MTIARQPESITFTAVNEGVSLAGRPITILGMTFRGTGLTASQIVTVRDSATVASGSILADWITPDTVANADLWSGLPPRLVYDGISIDNNTVAGTWKLTVFYR